MPGLGVGDPKFGYGKKRKRKKSSGGFRAIDPGRDANSLAEAIERQAAAQKHQAEKKAAAEKPAPDLGIDPIQALQDQLFSAMNSINVAPTPYQSIFDQASQQVGLQFDPVIRALAQQMTTHKQRGKRSQGEARDMYGALSKDFISQLPALTEQFAAEDRETNTRYDQAQGELQKQYADQSAQQDAVMRRLGIQAAQQDASQQSRDDQKYFQSQMELDQQQAMNALNEQQNAAQTYQRDLGNNAKMTGENTAQDIGRMLEEYMMQAEGEMSGLQSQKSQTLASLISQMQGQDAQRVQQQEQQQSENMMDMFRFQLDALNSSEDRKLAAQKLMQSQADPLFKGTTGLAGAQNYLAQTYPDQGILGRNLMQHVNQVLQNPDVVRGKFVLNPGNESLGKGPTYSDVGQEYMLKILRDSFKNEDYGPTDINNAVNALLAYLGKLR